MIVFLGLLATTIILWPIMRAFGRRLEGKAAPDPALQAEIEQLQHRLGEVDVLQQRVAELEERLDFTERILAQARARGSSVRRRKREPCRVIALESDAS